MLYFKLHGVQPPNNDDNFGLDCVFAASNYIPSKPGETARCEVTLVKS